MSRPLRLSFENAFYHITARGNRREYITENQDIKNPLREPYRHIALGSETFITNIICLLKPLMLTYPEG